MREFDKTSDAELSYSIDYVDWLEGYADIVGSTWSTFPADLSIEDTTFDQEVTTVSVSGGTDKVRYKISNEVTLSTGEKETFCFYIRIQPCRLNV